jgi:hypothetical protein
MRGKWTPNEIIGHLTDSEWVYGALSTWAAN